MWWLDSKAVATGIKLRDFFRISTYVETGTFRGINLNFWSYYFPLVIGVEKSSEYEQETFRRILKRPNVSVIRQSSPDYLNWYADLYRKQAQQVDTPPIALFYLDAHFYDPSLPLEKRWVVKDELRALREFPNCLIAIHDFDCNGLGHLVYDGQPLNWEVIGEDILAVNPHFSFYANTREGCKTHTLESARGIVGIDVDDPDVQETITYHNTDRLKYRGILYATPRPLDLSVVQLETFIP